MQQTINGNKTTIAPNKNVTTNTTVYTIPTSNAPIGPPITDNIKKNHMAAKCGKDAIPIGHNPVTPERIIRTTHGGQHGKHTDVNPITITETIPISNNGI